ncbi:dTMP kinase [cyanobiont of Ornithocercus magnificus]|nr:dTMP kinase [cyanobiont of Ornithocercus magnificus]
MSDQQSEKLPRGKFIALEGIDGAGKTSQLEELAAWLPSSGLMPPGARLIKTEAPGGTKLGDTIRDWIFEYKYSELNLNLTELAEFFLFIADYVQQLETVIHPALSRGDWVISDRSLFSALAYHVTAAEINIFRHLRQLLQKKFKPGGAEPDIVIWLDLDLEAACARVRRRFCCPPLEPPKLDPKTLTWEVPEIRMEPILNTYRRRLIRDDGDRESLLSAETRLYRKPEDPYRSSQLYYASEVYHQLWYCSQFRTEHRQYRYDNGRTIDYNLDAVHTAVDPWDSIWIKIPAEYDFDDISSWIKMELHRYFIDNPMTPETCKPLAISYEKKSKTSTKKNSDESKIPHRKYPPKWYKYKGKKYMY